MIFLFLLLTLVTTTLCQMEGTRADMRFSEDNDRYDVSNIVQMQNQIYRQQMDDAAEDYDDFKMARRNNEIKSHRRHEYKKIPDASFTANARRNAFLLQEDLDNYRADNDAEIDSFWFANAKPLGRQFLNRRSEDKSQQLLSYAVPIHVKIQGYLQAPSDKK